MRALIAELAKISSVLVIINWIPPFTYPLNNSSVTLNWDACHPNYIHKILKKFQICTHEY
jgi:hypothetical protein